MDRCWLKGAEGDALHAVLCAAGYNIRWLLRAITRLGGRSLLLVLSFAGRVADVTRLIFVMAPPTRPSLA